MKKIKWIANRDPKATGLPVTEYTAHGDGWSATVKMAAGSGWEATLTLDWRATWRWPVYHEGITGKGPDQCKRWVRRTLTDSKRSGQ